MKGLKRQYQLFKSQSNWFKPIDSMPCASNPTFGKHTKFCLKIFQISLHAVKALSLEMVNNDTNNCLSRQTTACRPNSALLVFNPADGWVNIIVHMKN